MSERRPNDSCRICKSSFKVKFGNIPGKQVYSSSENLFRPSQRKDSLGIVLAEVCSRVGLVLLHDPATYSDRVCNPCGRKIRSLGQLFEFVKVGTTPTVNSVSKSTKRTMATPEKASPSWRKSKLGRVNSPTAKTLSLQSAGKSRKSRPRLLQQGFGAMVKCSFSGKREKASLVFLLWTQILVAICRFQHLVN